MRKDQQQRLEELTVKLAEVVLEEADPEQWAGAGKPLNLMTTQERGDRFWCKRNAAATLGLLERVQRTLTDAATVPPRVGDGARDDLDSEITAAEREASKALEKARERAAGIVKRSRANG